MKILYEFLGGNQEVDLDDPKDYLFFVNEIIQDEETAQELITDIFEHLAINEEHYENDDWEPQFIVRYTRTS